VGIRISDPMAYKSDILLGKIIKLSGYEGVVAVKLEKNLTENIPRMESVFLEIEGKLVPFFISGFEYNGADILKLSFDGYDSKIKISEFIGCRIFLISGTAMTKHKDDPENLIGYEVFVKDEKLLGSISNVMINSEQWLINIKALNNKNILIPFHEDFIVSLDKKRKVIIMNLPEGLTEIN
jgi:16S rRNA processing protein RimM